MAKSILYSVLLMTWWWILLQRPSPHLKSSTLPPNSDCTTLEGECWNSKHCQPNTSTFVHLYIDGFSCHYQLMPSAGMFIPVIPFHYHMILFSNSPLFSLPSFLHDSLTMQFRTFPVPSYLVIFISCPSDIVPHSSAISEVSYFIHMMLRPISY